ncbi:DsbA family protein [Gordonia sp. NPDC003424]
MPSNTSKYQPRATSSRATYILAGAAVLIIAALVIGGVVWNSQRDKGTVDEAVLNDNAALIIGAASAPQTIDVFEDFMCPYCREFEQQSGAAMSKAVDDGKLRVRYHMLTFLNKMSASGDYSSRAAGAAQCVGEAESKDIFLKFHAALFENQPKENGDSDLSNAEMATIAAQQGASAATQKCITDGSMVEQANVAAAQSQNQLSKALGGQASTPTVLSAGEPVPDIMNGTAWLDKLLSDKN